MRSSIQRNRSMLKWLLWFVLVLPTAVVAGEKDVDPLGVSHFSQGGVSLDQAADMVRRTYGGRVLSITPVNRGGEEGFRVRVLVDGGRVKSVFVDDRGRMSGQ